MPIVNFAHLPEAIQEEFRHKVLSGECEDPYSLQQWLLQHKFSVTKERVRGWVTEIPCDIIEDVHDLPDDVYKTLHGSFVERRPKAEVIDLCAKLGYKVNANVIDKWFGQLLRDAQEREVQGEVGPSGVSLQQEFETRTLTWTLDFFLSLISDIELKKPKVRDCRRF